MFFKKTAFSQLKKIGVTDFFKFYSVSLWCLQNNAKKKFGVTCFFFTYAAKYLVFE